MLTVVYVMWYLLVFSAIVFFISGLDELFFDIYYWCYYFYRRWKIKPHHPLTYENLVNKLEKRIAILVPCWHEYSVIEQMLRHNVNAIEYTNYDFFIGLYCNDPKTIHAVKQIANTRPHIKYVISKISGPTTKGANLNVLYAAIVDHEKLNNIHYDIFVLHDSEDIIHPLSLKIYNSLLPRKQMIQLPVFPLETNLFNFTHWIYNDEFAENHTKNLTVREAIRGLVPSAGVGTGFSREAIEALTKDNNGQPFSTNTLTEDYNAALRIRLKGLEEIFVVQTIPRMIMKKKWGFFGKKIPKNINEWIATRAFFPSSYRKAVKQKARWITGISMQEWRNSGWPGNFSTRYTLFHDRKIAVTHFMNILGYMIFLFWIFYSTVVIYHPAYPTLRELLNKSPWISYLVVSCMLIMVETLCQRVIAVYRIYGLLPALLSIPRTLYANFLNMHALLLAYRHFILSSKTNSGRWEKTDHDFPDPSQLKSL